MVIWFDRIRNLKILLIVVAIVIAIASLLTSSYLTNDLKREELNKMEVWAEAMSSLNQADENTDINLVLKVLNGNNTIPVIVLDQDDSVQTSRNLGRQFKAEDDSTSMIRQMAHAMKAAGNSMRIDLDTPGDYIEICYDESLMLKRLAVFPYVQLAVVIIFVIIALFALFTSMRAISWEHLSVRSWHGPK